MNNVFLHFFPLMDITMDVGKLYSETFTAGHQIDRLRELESRASYESKDKAQITHESLFFMTTTLTHQTLSD